MISVKKIIIILILLVSAKCNDSKSDYESRKIVVNQILSEIKDGIRGKNLKERNFNYRQDGNDNAFDREFNLSRIFLNSYGIPNPNEFIDDSLTMRDAHILKVPIFKSKNRNDTLSLISFEFVFVNRLNRTDFQNWSLIYQGSDSIHESIQKKIDSIKIPEYLKEPEK